MYTVQTVYDVYVHRVDLHILIFDKVIKPDFFKYYSIDNMQIFYNKIRNYSATAAAVLIKIDYIHLMSRREKNILEYRMSKQKENNN